LAAGKAARVGLLQAEQQRLNGGQLQVEQPKVNVVLQAGQQGVDLATSKAAKVKNYLQVGAAKYR
jgi:hypothetical protein